MTVMVEKLLGFGGKKAAAGGQSSRGIRMIALLAAALFVVWLIISSMDPPSRRPLLSGIELTNRAILVALARKCQGDVKKLHGADLDQVDRLCTTHGDACMDILYHDPHHGDGVYIYANGQIH